MNLILWVEVLAQHVAHSVTYQALMLLIDESVQMKKVIVQDHMVLDLLIITQGDFVSYYMKNATFIYT